MIQKKPIRLPSNYMLILCSIHTISQLLYALLENPVALKVLVWSRGRLVTLHILTNSSFSLVEETHSSSGQCVSFFIIGAGSVLLLFLEVKWKKRKEKTMSTQPCKREKR